jgi:hypothetical protein
MINKPHFNSDILKYEFNDFPNFTPSYSPIEMISEGVFGGNYFGNINVKKDWVNYVPHDFLIDLKSNLIEVEQLLTNKTYNKSTNSYKVLCGMDYLGWVNSGWIKEQDPFGWFNWFINFYYGRRSVDDIRQINRWSSFVSRHSGMLKSLCAKHNKKISDNSIGLKTKQGLLHWSYNTLPIQ